MLNNARVLIVEDEALVAFDLSLAVVEEKGEVLGPCTHVRDALDLLDTGELIDAAILDINLADGLVTPLATRLLDAGIAVIFHSASAIPAPLGGLTDTMGSCPKVAPAERVIARLEILLLARGRVPTQC